MDETLRHKNPNPILTANFLSRTLFWWLNPLLKTGYKRQLEKDDMFNVVQEDASDYLGNRLEGEWQKEIKKLKETGKKPSLMRALARCFGVQYMLLGIIVFIEEGTKVVQPLLLGGLIRFFTPKSTISQTEAYLYAMGVSLCAIVLAIAHHPYFFSVTRIGMQMRVACCSLMYKKALRLSNKALGQTTVGQIVNLMSNDVNRFDQAVIFLHFLWVGPVQAIAVLVILWYELGPAVLAGFAVLILLIPLQGWMGKLFSKLRQKTAVHTDERVRVMNEIISGMRVIKMYCWEKPFGDLVEKIRSQEVKKVHRSCNTQAFLLGPSFVAGKLVVFFIMVTSSLAGITLSSASVFITMGIVQACRVAVTKYLGLGIQFTSELSVCFRRFQFGCDLVLTFGITALALFWERTVYQMKGLAEYSYRAELKIVGTRNYWKGYFISQWHFLIHLCMFPLMIVLHFCDLPVIAYQLFMARALLHVMAGVGIGFLNLSIQTVSEATVAAQRVQTFLCLEELDESSLVKKTEETDRPPIDKCFVRLDNVMAKWDPAVDQNTLEKISASVKAGELLAVIGPVGAGKSSLLMSILGELPAKEGQIEVTGKIAYVAQQPWVFSASLRQNVTMGDKFDSGLYEKSIRACALKKDLEIMPHGDSTLIGDRGVSLSGGQRARVSLARALYTNSDIYLLDDPLSAVDAAVGRHIFEKCIQGVLRKKPRILVTHQVQYLTEADMILILKDGKILGTGTYDELSKSGIDFASLLKQDDEEDVDDGVMSLPDTIPNGPPDFNVLGSTTSLASITSDFVPETIQTQQEEERQEGTVGFRVYIDYFRAGSGIFIFLLLVLLNLVAQTAYVMSDWWLSRWSNEEELRFAAVSEHEAILAQGINITNVTIPVIDTNLNIYIFTGIVASVFVFGLLRALLFFKVAVDASQCLHNRMFSRILRTPISFFDQNPVGRILNRFSKDVGHMDDLLPVTFFDFIQCFLLIIGIVIVAGVINPWVFIPTVPLCGLFVIIRRYYLASSRSIKRLEGTTRSPVFSHLSASLQGLHTIRAFNMENKFMAEFDAHQDLHTEAWFLFLSSSRWLAVRLDWLCALFVTAVCFCSILSAGSLDAGLVGLSITYAMTLMGMFQWGVRQSAEVENQMISVERVLEYSRLPTEASLDSDPSHKPPSTWPQHGIITGEKACLKYGKTGPNVLKELNFCVRAQEKVGIVGRTGAGKSSLITMLFRLVEPKGKLMIDGVNILEIGLHDLRKTISIIPQDPVLFTGALRRNLDPFSHHQDPELWKSLEEVELKSAIEELPGQLETEVSEGGINFSVGQRQLICLARAILRKNKILLIDEATANVDPKTDELIQATIRDKFRQCTVLTIAHRLHTIMDSDRVLVLDEGKIIDFDEPHLLLEKGQGHFYQMVQQTGKTEAEYLAEIAHKAYQTRHQSETGSQKDLEKIKLTLDANHTSEKKNTEEEDSAISGSGSEEKGEEEDKESSPLLESKEDVSQEDLKSQDHKSSKDVIPSEDISQGEEEESSPLLGSKEDVKSPDHESSQDVNPSSDISQGGQSKERRSNGMSPNNDDQKDDDVDDKNPLLPSDDVVEMGPSTPIVSIAKQKRSSRDLTDAESAATPLLQDASETTDTVDV